MQKILLFIFGIIATLNLFAQNLVVNPGAESPPGTGWTIVNAGLTTCSSAPTNTYDNWTMVPDNLSINHPFDHTTGAAGGRVFFAGCNPFSFSFTRF